MPVPASSRVALTAALLLVVGVCIALPAPALAAPAALAARPGGSGPAQPSLQIPNPFDLLFQSLVGNPFKAGAQKTLKTAMDASEASFLTPALDRESRVVQIWTTLLEIADALLLLLVIVGAVMVVIGDWTYLEAKALAPRVVVAGVAMNLSLPIMGQAIGWSNDMVKGFLSFGDVSLTPAMGNAFAAAQAPIVLALLVMAALFLLLANMIRLVVVLTLTVGAPLLHVFGVLPATDGIARAWWRAMAACLIAPAVQALLLVLAVWIASTDASPFRSVFNNPLWSSLVDSTMVLVLVAFMAISPLWMLKRALGEGHEHLTMAMRWGRRAVGAMS